MGLINRFFIIAPKLWETFKNQVIPLKGGHSSTERGRERRERVNAHIPLFKPLLRKRILKILCIKKLWLPSYPSSSTLALHSHLLCNSYLLTHVKKENNKLFSLVVIRSHQRQNTRALKTGWLALHLSSCSHTSHTLLQNISFIEGI